MAEQGKKSSIYRKAVPGKILTRQERGAVQKKITMEARQTGPKTAAKMKMKGRIGTRY